MTQIFDDAFEAVSHADTRFSDAEANAMDLALKEALRGPRGANPLVGAVILDALGTVISIGHHRGAGTAHAEADALNRARERGHSVVGATIIVTLEPCNHTGRTGPCTQAIIDAGISRVVYAIADPHDPAAGGERRLLAAGLEVERGLGESQAAALNKRWFASVTERRPFVTLHLAQTLDARIAAEDGTSQWISGPESLADNHAERRLIDAILVGTGTVEIDDPRLTARDADGQASEEQPLRVVMGHRPIPEGARIIGDGHVLHVPSRDPREVLSVLFDKGIRHVLIEGGSSIISAFLRSGTVDELIVYLAPTLLGSGTNALNGIGVQTLADAQHWVWDAAGPGAVVPLGRDLRLHLKPTD